MSEAAPGGRILFVDRLRGLAVLAMIVAHTAGAWIRPEERGTSYWKVTLFLSGLAAPVFLFLVGVSVALLALRAEAQGRDPQPIRRRLLRRGLSIWALGYALHVGYWVADEFWGTWSQVLRVDVLHCIGSGLVVVSLLAWPRKRFSWEVLVAFVLLGLAGQAVNYVPLQAVLPAGLSGYLTQRSVHGLFPIVPYWAYIALGLLVGSAWVKHQWRERPAHWFWLGLGASVLLLLAVSRWVHWLYYHWFLRIHAVDVLGRPSRGLLYVLLEKSAWVLAIFVAVRLVSLALDRLRRRPVVLLGQTSLFVYGVHLFFIYHLGGKSLRGRLGPAEHLRAAAILALGMLVLAWLWRRSRARLWDAVESSARRVLGLLRPDRSVPSRASVCAPVTPPRAPRSPSDS